MFKTLLLLISISFSFTLEDNSKENETITKLNLSNKGLMSLNDYDFTKYPRLEELDLSNNLIENISEDKFTKTKLKKLNLSGNTELKLPEFSTLLIADIEELNLSNCNIEVLPPSILDGLIKLKVIDLSDNPLKSIKLITFTNLLSPQKIILPNLDDKKTITEICNELNITIEDNEQSLKCADIRNGKWEGIKKDNTSSLKDIPNVDAPINPPNIEEKTNPQTDTQEPVVDVNVTNKEESPQNAPEVTYEQENVNKSVENKQNKNESDVPETPDANDEPISAKKAPDTAADTPPHPLDTKSDVDLQAKNLETTGDNSTNAVSKISKDGSLTTDNNKKVADDQKTSETDSKKPQTVTNQETIEKVNNATELPGSKAKDEIKEPAGESKPPQSNQDIVEKQNDTNKTQEETVLNPVSNDGKEIVPTKQTVLPLAQAPKSPVDTPQSNEPKIAIQRRIPIPPLDQENPKPDVLATAIHGSAPTATENKQISVNKESHQIPPTAEQADLNSKIQFDKQAQQIKQEGSSEAATGASTPASTGTNILIFLVVAVIISGIAAFGYKFYKTRTYRPTSTQEPIERELQEIVTDKNSNGPAALGNVLEEEPLMQKNENSVETNEANETKESHSIEANHATGNSKP